VAFHGWVLSIWNVFWTLAIGHYRPGRWGGRRRSLGEIVRVGDV
jgi:hypothetical protein